MKIYTASKSQAQGRPGWSVSFRHPLRLDVRNKPGLKMRKGLGTTSPEEADQLTAELNEILSDDSWWTMSRRAEAALRFDQRVVDVFYEDIEAPAATNRSLRDLSIPLPTKEEGYSRVLFVGTTGAGKTSLLRHLIGSDPDEDRFPSTSTAKTTIAETEVVLAEGPFKAVVTFFSEAETRVAIEECVVNACSAALEGAGDERVIDRFLNHPDQRLRLGYSLGAWRKSTLSGRSSEEDDWSFDEDAGSSKISELPADEDAVTDAEAEENQKSLEAYVGRVRALVSAVGIPLLKTLQVDFSSASPDDQDTILELLESELHGNQEFSELIHDVVDDIQSRLDLVPAGAFERKHGGWPVRWTFSTGDRKDFIRHVRWFSSNYAPSYGRLLTPLVDGIRVQGPLFPTFTGITPSIILLDGQGLGHTPDSTTSVSTQITRRFAEADVILLVDNAEQPMQAAPLAVLSSVGTSGNYGKLAVVFTHFDQVKGDNLPNPAAKREHILASVRNGITSLREVVGGGVANSLGRAVEKNSYMLGALQAKSNKLPGGVVKELERLLQQFEEAIQPATPPNIAPVYNLVGLDFAIQAATTKFQERWSAKLGLATRSGVNKEHWTRVKALNRRIIIGQDHYNHLQPVADLIRELQTQVSSFLDSPTSWTREPANDDEVQEALAGLRQSVFRAVHDLARNRVVDEPQSAWQRAFLLSGRGSTFERAEKIDAILDDAAPIPGPAMQPKAKDFLKEVRDLVEAVIADYGARVEAA